MSAFPPPCYIRRNWRAMAIDVPAASAFLENGFFSVLWAKRIVEVRAWRIARGKGRGGVARIDYVFDDGSQASLRFLSRGVVQLRLGQECCR